GRADNRASHTQLGTQRGSGHRGECAAHYLGDGKPELAFLGLLVVWLPAGLGLSGAVRQFLSRAHVLVASTRASGPLRRSRPDASTPASSGSLSGFAKSEQSHIPPRDGSSAPPPSVCTA